MLANLKVHFEKYKN
jgi:hypothetical protein